MRKLILGLPLVTVVAVMALLFFAGRVAEARWAYRDSTAVNPISVCRDGMYIGVGHESNPGPVEVTALLQPGGEEVFHREYNNLPPNTDENADLAYSDYFLESWDAEDQPLMAGDVITLAGGSDNPTSTVENCYVLQAAPAASGFSYQGMLYDEDQPASGSYDLRFRLWDAANGGSSQGSPVTVNNVPVSEGVFNVRLDFGPTAFSSGRARWLEMSVRPAGSGVGYTTLAPRQELLAAPYAHSLIAGAGIIGHSVEEPALTVENRLGAALQVGGGFQGLVVNDADRDGVRVDSAGYDAFSVGDARVGLNVEQAVDGLYVDFAFNNGVEISRTNFTAMQIGSAGWNALEIDSAGANGIEIGSAERTGFYIGSAGWRGLHVGSAEFDGVLVGNAGGDGVHISSAMDDGVTIASTGDDGIDVESAGFWGMYINSTQYSGIWIQDAGSYGVYADTNVTNGYGFYTPDRIYGSNVTASSLSLVAQVTGTETLQRGDIVSAAGVTTLNEDGSQLLPQVVRADATGGAGVIGVVESRLALARAESGEAEAERAAMEGDGPASWRLRAEDGPAQAGDYVSLIIYGVTYVRLEAGAALEPGMRLTPADSAGTVRPLRTEAIQGMTVTEGTPVIGVLLDVPDAESGLAPVFVTLR